MKRLWCIVLLIAANPLLAEEKPKQADPKLEGQWKITWGADRGTAVPAFFDIHWTITKENKVAVTYGSDPQANITDEFTMILDPKAGTLDRKKGEEITLGLFRMDDEDHLVVCFNFSSKDRPGSIDSNFAFGYTVYRLERIKPK